VDSAGDLRGRSPYIDRPNCSCPHLPLHASPHSAVFRRSEGAAEVVRLYVVAVNAVLHPCILRITSRPRKPSLREKTRPTVDGYSALGSSRSVILLRVEFRIPPTDLSLISPTSSRTMDPPQSWSEDGLTAHAGVAGDQAQKYGSLTIRAGQNAVNFEFHHPHLASVHGRIFRFGQGLQDRI
jgi:hypothetical protein